MKRSFYILIYFILFWIMIPGLFLYLSPILNQRIFPDSRLPDRCIIPGYILCISGFLLLLVTIYQFKLQSGEYPVSATPPKKIIQRGIFAVWRHPIYLFASITLLGFTLIMRSQGLLLIFFPVFIVLVYIYIIREESILIKRFGNEYKYYRNNVPLVIPNLHQWLKIPGFIFFKICFRLKVHYRENIPSSLPFIVVSGHRHYFDPFIVSYAVPIPLKHISTFEMFRTPLNRRLFTWLGVIPRKRFVKDIPGTQKILSALGSGYPICIFPEGGRSWTNRLRSFKPESLKLLKHVRNLPVIPVRIEGNYHSWPRWANRLMRSDITVTFEQPVYIDPDIDLNTLEIMLKQIVEPREEIEGKKVCRSTKRIENLSKVIYRCPVCLCFQSIVEVMPDSLYCRTCNTKYKLKSDFKVEYNCDNHKKAESIYTLYNLIKIRYSDIYTLLSKVMNEKYQDYLKPGEKLIYTALCQLWEESKSVFNRSKKGLCILSNRTITISDCGEQHIIPLAEIGAVTIESNYKLQIYNKVHKVLVQITFDNDSVLKWQDLLAVVLSEQFNKQIITR